MIRRFDFKKIKKNYNEIFNYLRKKKYFINLHYFPLHLQPLFKRMGFKKGMFPISEKYAREAISIPIYPTIKKNHIDRFISTLKTFIY